MNYVKSLLLCCLVSGCAAQSGNTTLGEKSSTELKVVLTKGVTTQDEVQKMFGEPNDTDIMADGRIKWVYSHVRNSAMARNFIPVVNWFSSGTDNTTRKLVIILKNKIVEDFTSSTSEGETKGGLLN